MADEETPIVEPADREPPKPCMEKGFAEFMEFTTRPVDPNPNFLQPRDDIKGNKDDHEEESSSCSFEDLPNPLYYKPSSKSRHRILNIRELDIVPTNVDGERSYTAEEMDIMPSNIAGGEQTDGGSAAEEDRASQQARKSSDDGDEKQPEGNSADKYGFPIHIQPILRQLSKQLSKSNQEGSKRTRKSSRHRSSIIQTTASIVAKMKRVRAKKKATTPAFDTVEGIEAYLKEELKLKLEMTKSELRKVLLDTAGIYVEDHLLDAIFIDTDKDGSGTLDAKELATFIHNVKPSTAHQRRKYVLKACLLYVPFYLSFFCLNASLISAITNLRERQWGDLYGESHNYWTVASCSDLIGLIGYVILKWEDERLKYENIVHAKVRLIKWIKSDLPRFANKKKLHSFRDEGPPDIERGGFTPGSNIDQSTRLSTRQVSFALSDDCSETKNKEDTDEKRKEEVLKPQHYILEGLKDGLDIVTDGMKVTKGLVTDGIIATGGLLTDFEQEVAANIRAFLSKNDSAEVEGDVGLDLQELRLLLETMGVHLGDKHLAQIFYEIDYDRSGVISIAELLEYTKKSEAKLVNMNSLVKYRGILKRCFKSIGWWGSLSFLSGATCWVTLSLTGYIDGTSFEAQKRLLEFTVILYLIGALSNLSNLYRATQIDVFNLQSANVMLRGAAIAVGLSQLEKTSEWLDESYVSSDHDTPQWTDVARLELAQAAKKAVKRMNTSASGTSGTSSQYWLESYSPKKIQQAQEIGANTLFQLFDTSQDENVDVTELYDALVQLGIMIPNNTFLALFHSVDSSGDGNIQIEEFSTYVARIKPEMPTRERRIATLKYMLKSISLYLVIVQIFAGSSQTHAAWFGLSTVKATKNLFLSGSFGWAIGSVYFILTWPKSKGNFFDQLENAKFMIRQSIMQGCEIYYNNKSSHQKKSDWNNLPETAELVNMIGRKRETTNEEDMGDEHAPTGVVIDEQSDSSHLIYWCWKHRKRGILLCMVLIFLVLLAIVLGVTLSSKSTLKETYLLGGTLDGQDDNNLVAPSSTTNVNAASDTNPQWFDTSHVAYRLHEKLRDDLDKEGNSHDVAGSFCKSRGMELCTYDVGQSKKWILCCETDDDDKEDDAKKLSIFV